MFEIEYKGANCIVITTKKGKIVFDPKLSLVGLKDVPVKDVFEIVTEDRFATDATDAVLLINGPGDYGIIDIDIHGVPACRHLDSGSQELCSTMYRLEIDETRVGVIGNIYEKLTDEQLEELGVIDVLIIPIGGGGYTLDATGATALTRAIGPKVVIPVHYVDKNLKYEVPQGDLGVFVSELGAPVETVSKYKSKQSSMTQAPLTIVEITRS